MRLSSSPSAAAWLAVLLSASGAASQRLENNLGEISRHWGQISVYADNDEHDFGVKTAGLPDGCQVEQAHLLQRHAQRFPTGSLEDGASLCMLEGSLD